MSGIEAAVMGGVAALFAFGGECPQPGRIENVDLIAPQRHQALSGKAFEQAAHDFAYAAALVCEFLVGDVPRLAAANQTHVNSGKGS